MPVTHADRDRMIAQLIHDYFKRFPHAVDTVEGIQRWWIPQCYGHTSEEVERALDILVAAGVVVKHKLLSGQTLFALLPLDDGRK
jgi:hypothetical protein